MDVYKDFIQHLRRLAYEEVYILLCDITPKLMEYVRLITEVKFIDGSYHTFYGDLKKILDSFINYFTQAIDEVIKDADKCGNEITRDDLMQLMEKTILIHHSNQVEFGNAFLPITTPAEKLVYEEIEKEYNDYMKKLYKFKEYIEKFQKQDKVLEFGKEHFKMAVKKTSAMFNLTYDYLALMMADCLNKIRTSLEEILLRLNSNLTKMQDECEDTLNNLMHQLYDKNKESLFVCRSDRRNSVEMAEVCRSIEVIRNKIENFETEAPLARLEEEVAYWQERLKDFNEVATNLVKLKLEQENVIRQEQIYNSMRTTELPGQRRCCWINMGENFKKQKAYLKQKILEEARAMVTFFACRGVDRILYTDNKGPYYVDEFNHQIYVYDYGLGTYHVNCEGGFRQDTEYPYYFDKNGRYINQYGKKLYQCGKCTSLYNLEDNDLLTKIGANSPELIKKGIKVSGDSDLYELQCRTLIKDPNDVVVLPEFDPMDISNTLDNKTVKYLWDSFGSLLPDALHDVGMAKPKNPIHYLAHKLLYHKYKRTTKELRQKETDAEEFRAGIFKERKEEAVSLSKAWKAKQVPRRKPEESDDAQERAVYNAHIAQREFINSLNDYS